MNKITLRPVYFIILGVILGLGGFFLLLANPFGWKTIRPTLKTTTTSKPTPAAPGNGLMAAPTPILILPKGKQTYTVRGGDTDISRVTSVTVDPLDAKKGDKQTLTVKIASKEPVKTFNVVLNSDNGGKEYSLALASGDTSNGTWETSYTLTDSTSKIYSFVFNIITNNGNKTVNPFLVR